MNYRVALDLVPEDEREARVAAFVKSMRYKGPVFAIAAISGDGCRGLTYAIQDWLDARPAEPATPDPGVETRAVLTPAPVRARRRRKASPSTEGE